MELDIIKIISELSISTAVIYMLFRLLTQTLPNQAVLASLTEALEKQAEVQVKFNETIIQMCMKMSHIAMRDKEHKDASNND
jgi:hypothetical protein